MFLADYTIVQKKTSANYNFTVTNISVGLLSSKM